MFKIILKSFPDKKELREFFANTRKHRDILPRNEGKW